MDDENVTVLWANGEETYEPLAEFKAQIPPMEFAHHVALMKMPPQERRNMLEQMAKGAKAAAGKRKPQTARCTGRRSGGRCSHQKKQKTPKQASSRPLQGSDSDGSGGIDSLQTALERIHVSKATCSFCGTVCVLCFQCTATASCMQRVCMHCWTLATTAGPGAVQDTPTSAAVPLAPDHFHCHEHGGAIRLPTHPTMQKYGLPSDQLQSIGVWASRASFPAYRSQLDTSTLQTVLLSAAGLCSGQQPVAVVLEYHSDVDHGNAVFDPPTHLRSGGAAAASSSPEADTSQVALLSRFIHPVSTKLAVLLTCGPYRKQLEAIRAASQTIYPHTTFDIQQLFVRGILSAVCSTVRQYLLYPSASPLHLAAEHFGKRLLQAYRPCFLFRGELLPIVHHSQDALTKCLRRDTQVARAGAQGRRVGGARALPTLPLHLQEDAELRHAHAAATLLSVVSRVALLSLVDVRSRLRPLLEPLSSTHLLLPSLAVYLSGPPALTIDLSFPVAAGVPISVQQAAPQASLAACIAWLSALHTALHIYDSFNVRRCCRHCVAPPTRHMLASENRAMCQPAAGVTTVDCRLSASPFYRQSPCLSGTQSGWPREPRPARVKHTIEDVVNVPSLGVEPCRHCRLSPVANGGSVDRRHAQG